MDKWIFLEAESQVMKENWLDEFSRKAKSGKLTVEIYHRIRKYFQTKIRGAISVAIR